MFDKPDFKFEEKYWRMGFNAVAGIDEVGRGSLAGPVVAGCAVIRTQVFRSSGFQKRILNLGIDDSKRLTSAQRIRLVPEIDKFFFTRIGEATVAEIDDYGIVKATHLAMQRAVISLQVFRSSGFQENNLFILVDGYYVDGLPGGRSRQEAIVRGDRKSVSIGAASIVAKVYRDRLMEELALNFREYNWGENKGYGTREHRNALLEHGQTIHHRLLFVDSIV